MQIDLSSQPATPPSGVRPVSRALLIELVQAAITVKELRFARQATLNWLALYPGDLPVNLLYAQTLMQSGLPEQALPVLERLCQADPEYRQAVDLLVQAEAHVRQAQEKEQRQPRRQVLPKAPGGSLSPTRRAVKRTEEETSGWLLGLGGNPDLAKARSLGFNRSLTKTQVEWSRNLIRARAALQRSDPALAEQELHPILAIDPNIPLAAALHLRALDAQAVSGKMPMPALRSLAAHYLERWPDLVAARLALANAAMRSSDPEQGVSLMHTAAAADITGQVAARMWGGGHSYQSIWASDVVLELDIPIPAAVAGVMGWNRLPSHTGAGRENISASADTQDHSSDDLLVSVQAELEHLSKRIGKPYLAKSDGRFPTYVIMTTRKGLVKRYGPQNAAKIDAAMLQLSAAIRQRKDYDAVLFYADEGVYIQDIEVSLGREPVRHSDPWALKLALTDLDKALKSKGERIGAVLIVGGPAVVPFHHLPNPVDDADVDVPSDNPYACRDENYFIPEWPLGRLPDGAPRGVSDPEPLVKALEALASRHR
jgi:tetratricopeptide (TPR) repeat protein